MIRLFFDQLPGLLVGVTLCAAALIVYNTAIENPSVRKEERMLVQAQNERHTQDAINEIASNADKARAMRAYCRSLGKLYDFATVGCID